MARRASGVPRDEVTSNDFISVRAALVRRLGGANEAIVWERIRFRTEHVDPPFLDAHGVAWWPAKRELIAHETGLSPDQVKRALASLVAGGFLDSAQHRQQGNWDRTVSYRPVIEPRAKSPNGPGEGARCRRANSPNLPISQEVEEGGPTTAPTPFCKKHPDGTDEPCGPCKSSRVARERWEAAQPPPSTPRPPRASEVDDCAHGVPAWDRASCARCREEVAA